AGDARDVVHQRDSLSGEAVEQRRFPDVRPADNRNDEAHGGGPGDVPRSSPPPTEAGDSRFRLGEGGARLQLNLFRRARFSASPRQMLPATPPAAAPRARARWRSAARVAEPVPAWPCA